MLGLIRNRTLVLCDLYRSISVNQNYGTKSDVDSPLLKKRILVLSKLLEIPNIQKTKKMLEGSSYLFTLETEHVASSFYFLKSIGITTKQIREAPTVLRSSKFLLRNRYEILLECGFTSVNAVDLSRCMTLIGYNERKLKLNCVIPSDTDVQARLCQTLNIKLHRSNENDSLKTIRSHLLQLYFQKHFKTTKEEFEKTLSRYNLVHNSFTSCEKLMDVLINHLNLTRDEIKGYFDVFSADYENVKKIITLPPIGGVEMKALLRLHPILIHKSSYDSIKMILRYLKEFSISEVAILHCPGVLTMKHEIVRERLLNLVNIKEFRNCSDHPRILYLVLHQPRARARLDYLKELGMENLSVNVLSGNSSVLQRYLREGKDRNRKNDIVRVLANIFKKESCIQEINGTIGRHPHSSDIPLFQIKQTINALKYLGYNTEDIYPVIQIVFYSSELLLRLIREFKFDEKLSKSTQLSMILYSIEKDFDFSGDGVWLERITTHNLD